VGARVQPHEVGVAVKDGVVILRGTVESYMKKTGGRTRCSSCPHVKAVANEIEVTWFSSAERNDANVAAAAVRALEWNALVPIERLDVTVSTGWATLRGGGRVSSGYPASGRDESDRRRGPRHAVRVKRRRSRTRLCARRSSTLKHQG